VIHGAPGSTYYLNQAQATGGSHSTVTGPEPAGDSSGRKRWRLAAGAVGGLGRRGVDDRWAWPVARVAAALALASAFTLPLVTRTRALVPPRVQRD
jgi:hypothetical protein